ncbi:MAG: hypothetical protein IT537_06630 [Hyphomicrobiales bacterium]|nr:hypothetical protein [Hyphomicrobiales bacterium]
MTATAIVTKAPLRMERRINCIRVRRVAVRYSAPNLKGGTRSPEYLSDIVARGNNSAHVFAVNPGAFGAPSLQYAAAGLDRPMPQRKAHVVLLILTFHHASRPPFRTFILYPVFRLQI